MSLFSLALVLLACGAGQSAECAAYMSCLEALDAQVGGSSASTVEALYGPTGSCWTEPVTAASCDAGCTAGLSAARDGASPVPSECEE